MKSPFAKGCLAIVLLLLVGGGYFFWRAKTPPVVGEDFGSFSPQEQQRRREDAKKLETEAKDIVGRIRSGDRSPFRLTASEQQLNTLLQDRIRTEKFAIRDLRAGLEPGELSLQGTVPYKGIETTVTLTGEVRAEDGRIIFDADKLLLGGLIEAPSEWKKKIEKQVTQQLNKLLDNAKVNVTNAQVTDGQLLVEGVPK